MNLSFIWDDGYFYQLVLGVSTHNSCIERFSQELNRLEELHDKICVDQTGTVYFNDEFYDKTINDVQIIEYVFGRKSVSRDEMLRLSILLSKGQIYDPSIVFDESIYDDEGYNAGCYLHSRGGVLLSSRTLDNKSWWDSRTMYQVYDQNSLVTGYRNYIIAENVDENILWQYSSVLFSNIYFNHQKVKFGYLQLPYAQHLTDVIHHLSYLNDHAQHDHTGDYQSLMTTASAQYNVELSPESPNTHKNKKAMKQRTIIINEHEVECELHTKITKTEGRIHFHIGTHLPVEVNQKTQGKIIVGLFANHLIT
ncbi:MAG: hypothetical protein ACI88H_000782 [Cocleimonas sp.]|jgi:hypothetical protein